MLRAFLKLAFRSVPTSSCIAILDSVLVHSFQQWAERLVKARCRKTGENPCIMKTLAY